MFSQSSGIERQVSLLITHHIKKETWPFCGIFLKFVSRTPFRRYYHLLRYYNIFQLGHKIVFLTSVCNHSIFTKEKYISWVGLKIQWQFRPSSCTHSVLLFFTPSQISDVVVSGFIICSSFHIYSFIDLKQQMLKHNTGLGIKRPRVDYNPFSG